MITTTSFASPDVPICAALHLSRKVAAALIAFTKAWLSVFWEKLSEIKQPTRDFVGESIAFWGQGCAQV
jgi:hypothetical protein